MTNIDFKKPYSLLYLSPHPDDLAFSSGGLIQKINLKNFVLLNVFTQSNFAPNLEASDVNKISRIRKNEDEGFGKVFGYKIVDLGLKDTSLRGHTEHCIKEKSVLKDKVYKKAKSILLKSIFQFSPEIIFCPMSLGDHIDHQIVYLIIRNSRQKFKARVFFYEDLPYAGEMAISKIESEIKKKIGKLAKTKIILLSSAELKNKLKNLSLYRSQIEQYDLGLTTKHARRLSRGRYAERIWTLD